MLDPAAGPVADADTEPRVAELLQARLGQAGKLLDDFDAPDSLCEFRQDRGLVAPAGADLEYRVAWFGSEKISG
jgi:hypothetical protein